MTWPTATDYQEAIQNPKDCFCDPDLKRGRPAEDQLGMPRPITGMFASVYEMMTPTGRWAVRCFLKRLEDHQHRYAAIGTHLKSSRLRSAIGFELIPQGIRVHGLWYPILKMQWVDGYPLSAYIARNLDQPRRLLRLIPQWVELVTDLRAAQIAHGDLQHGNVLVSASGLKIIDYDGMYVPALSGLPSLEQGHRNYQHPGRRQEFAPYLDHFSAWAILCSLVAIAHDPSLWTLVNGGDECLLFRDEDFRHPDQSLAFRLLDRSRPDVRALAAYFRSMLSMPIQQVPALDARLVSLVTAAEPRADEAAAMPGWLSGPLQPKPRAGIDAAQAGEAARVAAADWVIDHLKDQRTLAPQSLALERLALLLTACAASLTSWATTASVVSVVSGSALIAAAVGGCAALLVARYRRAPGMQERRETAALLRAAQAALAQRQTEREGLESQRNEMQRLLETAKAECSTLPFRIEEELRAEQARLAQLRSTSADRREELVSEQTRILYATEEASQHRIGLLHAERNEVDQKEREAVAAALGALQEQHAQNRLTRATLDDARLAGIGAKLKTTLRKHGILTARDVETSRIRDIRKIRSADAALLVSVLMSWKNDIVRDTIVPASLPDDQEARVRSPYAAWRRNLDMRVQAVAAEEATQRRSILDRFAQDLRNLDEQERKLAAAHEAAMQAIAVKFQREQARLDAQFRTLDSRLQPLIAEQDEKLAELNRRVEQQRFEVHKLQKELERYRALAAGSYVARIIGLPRFA